ncbi:MAG: DUF362 domain-containing protein [Dehalococcoidia bacterium]|nr:DUF362 domain-containing protein [Dehalococcoidia bacterium]
MILEAASFVFKPSSQISFARRILIKPSAAFPLPHPVTASRETLAAVISGIQRVSDADIILLEGNFRGEPSQKVFRDLGYDFPRVLPMDVHDSTLVEVENPLPKPYALPTFWLPNIILSCDYLISVAPFKVIGGSGNFTITNLLGLLPGNKYRGASMSLHALGQRFGMDSVIADLYFTIPFDLGIIDARKRLISPENPTQGKVEEYGKIMMGDPFEVDKEASESMRLNTGYLKLIEAARPHLKAEAGLGK